MGIVSPGLEGADGYRELRELAETCAKLGGSIVAEARPRGAGQIREKARNDFVTEVDAASEAAISALIRERHPDHRIIAEESATGGLLGETAKADFADAASIRSRTASAVEIDWIVDPLDGTKNFIHGYPAYAVSVAACGSDGVLAGAVYDPNRDELFSAARGGGASLNGEPLRVSAPEVLGRALIGTGFPFRFSHLSEPYLDSFRGVVAAFSDVRRGGSASLDLAYVACGRLDGFWELALSPWDMAAGWLLISEAGGVATDDEGGQRILERGHIVAGGPEVHAALLEVLRRAFAGRVEPCPGTSTERWSSVGRAG